MNRKTFLATIFATPLLGFRNKKTVKNKNINNDILILTEKDFNYLPNSYSSLLNIGRKEDFRLANTVLLVDKDGNLSKLKDRNNKYNLTKNFILTDIDGNLLVFKNKNNEYIKVF